VSELEITTGFDQPVQAGFADDAQWQYVCQQGQGALGAGDEQGNIEPIAHLANEYREGANLNLKGFALSIYAGRERAKQFGLTEAAYLDVMYIRTGMGTSTLRRHLRTWERLFAAGSKVPARVRPGLLERPMQSLYKIGQVVDRAKAKDWKEIDRAADHREVVKIVQKLKGDVPTAGLQFSIDRDGTFEVWEGKENAILGSLRNSDKDLMDPLRKRAYEAILGRVGGMEK